MTFNELHLHSTILKAVAELGYNIPTAVQAKSIPVVLEGLDVISSAQTGTGKTAAFALPILDYLHRKNAKKKYIKSIIVSPTRELAEQIHQDFKAYGKYTNIRSTVVYGGTSIEPQIDIIKKGVDIIIATPGRLLDLYKREVLNLTSVEILVLDEADLMLDMGFINDVNKIVTITPVQKQILLFSATMPQKVIDLTKNVLHEPVTINVTPTSSAAKNVEQKLYYVPKRKKMELCLHLLRGLTSRKADSQKNNILIFRRTKFGVDKLEKTLKRNGYEVVSFHGDKSQNIRHEALDKFRNNEVNILIATDVASRGIDITDLDIVINFDMPNIPETYVHRIGRTGRAGKNGLALSLCSRDEKSYVKSIQQLLNKAIPIEIEHPYPLEAKPDDKPKKRSGSKHKKGRKSTASKKKKKRWY